MVWIGRSIQQGGSLGFRMCVCIIRCIMTNALSQMLWAPHLSEGIYDLLASKGMETGAKQAWSSTKMPGYVKSGQEQNVEGKKKKCCECVYILITYISFEFSLEKWWEVSWFSPHLIANVQDPFAWPRYQFCWIPRLRDLLLHFLLASRDVLLSWEST